ncbi:putative ribosomal protein S30 [Helianthus anomalus]
MLFYEITGTHHNFFLITGKVPGLLGCAGKVGGQIPKVAKHDKKKKHRGRAQKCIQHNCRSSPPVLILSVLSLYFFTHCLIHLF